MKNYLNLALLAISRYKHLLIATALLLGLIGDAPPGGF